MITNDSIGNLQMSQMEFWTWIGILAIGVTIFLAWALTRVLRRLSANRGKFLICIGLYLFCCAMALTSGVFAHKLRLNADALARPSSATSITADWRADLDTSERTRLTGILAKSVYVNNGVITSYIGANGALVPFEPTAEDKKARESVTQRIVWTESFSIQAFYASIVWLLVPLLGLLLAIAALKGTPSRSDNVTT